MLIDNKPWKSSTYNVLNIHENKDTPYGTENSLMELVDIKYKAGRITHQIIEKMIKEN